MDPVRIDVTTPSRAYTVAIEHNAIDQLGSILDEVRAPERRFIVSSPLVWRLHGPRITRIHVPMNAELIPLNGNGNGHHNGETNGNGNGSAEPKAEPQPPTAALTDSPPVVPAKMGADLELGPACDQCGGMMQRTGSCYTCSSCGNNTGCG